MHDRRLMSNLHLPFPGCAAAGEPTTTSSSPDHRLSNAAKPASRTMNSVAPCAWLNARSDSISGRPISSRRRSPRALRSAGRGRSPGTVSRGAPASSCFQYDSCSARTSPDSHCRCHTAKSTYCTASSARGEGSPARKESRNPTIRKLRPGDALS